MLRQLGQLFCQGIAIDDVGLDMPWTRGQGRYLIPAEHYLKTNGQRLPLLH